MCTVVQCTDHTLAPDVYKLLNLVRSKRHIKLLSLIMYVGCSATSVRSPPRGPASEYELKLTSIAVMTAEYVSLLDIKEANLSVCHQSSE